MSELSYKTQSVKKDDVHKEWLLVDATDQVLGRLSSKVAKILRGKHKECFTPHVDCGDNIVIINAEKIRLTGKKWTDKEYIRYSNYPGGQKKEIAKEVHEKYPVRIIERSVKGMLPRNRLGRSIFKNLHVYEGAEHNQEAQKPKEIKLDDIK